MVAKKFKCPVCGKFEFEAEDIALTFLVTFRWGIMLYGITI